MKPRKRPLPASFLVELRCLPPTMWGDRPTFERFYNAGLDESRGVLRDLYNEAADRMALPADLHNRIMDVLGDTPLTTTEKPKFCAICTKPRKDLFPEKLNGKMAWVCTDCCVLSAGDPRYCFEETPPTPSRPLDAIGKGGEQ